MEDYSSPQEGTQQDKEKKGIGRREEVAAEAGHHKGKEKGQSQSTKGRIRLPTPLKAEAAEAYKRRVEVSLGGEEDKEEASLSTEESEEKVVKKSPVKKRNSPGQAEVQTKSRTRRSQWTGSLILFR